MNLEKSLSDTLRKKSKVLDAKSINYGQSEKRAAKSAKNAKSKAKMKESVDGIFWQVNFFLLWEKKWQKRVTKNGWK